MYNQQLIANRYQLGQLLSEGGMGAVYRGVDTQSNQAVAIKHLSIEKSTDQHDMIERFSREADALHALNHPNIVKVLDTVTEDEEQYIIMEFVGGGSLRELLDREGQISFASTVDIALDLADALTRAHRLEIIHRDLKPANILLAMDGSPRLSDFGIAKFSNSQPINASRLTQTGIIMGTPDYLSPEACRGEALDARTDIWALGIILFEMLTGKRPFPHLSASPTIAATLSAILTQPTPDLEALCTDVPIRFVDLIYRMLMKDREARIPSMRLVGAELEAIKQGESSTQYDVTELARSPRFATPTPLPTGIPQHNLPKQTTPFIGRDVELTSLARLIADPANRLITILGPGGSGKTRLALETARKQLPHFEGGVTFVPLAPLSLAENIISAIAEAVGFQFFESVEPKRQIINWFHNRQALILFDNFEHILDGAHLVREFLQAAPDIKVLVTSREKLNLQEEIRFRIEGMEVPEEALSISVKDAYQYSAIRLFIQAAKRARPSYDLGTEDLGYIRHICHLVRGMPLGILLAAAWVEMFSPQEITKEIDRSLTFWRLK